MKNDNIDLEIWLSSFFRTWEKTFDKVMCGNLSFIHDYKASESLEQKKRDAIEAKDKIMTLIKEREE